MKRAFVAGSKAHIKRNVTNLESESLQSEGIVRGACSGAHWMSHWLQRDNECVCNQCTQKHSLTGSAGVWGRLITAGSQPSLHALEGNSREVPSALMNCFYDFIRVM